MLNKQYVNKNVKKKQFKSFSFVSFIFSLSHMFHINTQFIYKWKIIFLEKEIF